MGRYVLKKKNYNTAHNKFKKRQNNDVNREWNKLCSGYKKLPHILPSRKRIVVIGDIHGDYNILVNSFRLAKLIDDKFNWVAEPKDTIVVQIGDQVDRCRPWIKDGVKQNCNEIGATIDDEGSDIKIMEFCTEMDERASEYGGRVISLFGNHEIMNSQGNLNYVSYEGLKQFANHKFPEEFKTDTIKDWVNIPNWDKLKDVDKWKIKRYYYFRPGSKYGKFMACTRQTAIIIGDLLFVHAGILTDLAKKYNNLEDLNLIVRKWLLGNIDKMNNNMENVTGINNVKDIVGSYNFSPFWPRIFGKIKPNTPAKDCEQFIGKVFEVYDINGMIVGHTPQFDVNKKGINQTCGNKVWRVDAGTSKAFKPFDRNNSSQRSVQVLEILDKNNEIEFNILT